MAIARVDFSVTSNTGKVSTHAVTKPPLAVTGNVGAVFTNINAASLTNEATLATQGWTKQYESFSTAHAICFTRIIDGTANDDFSGTTSGTGTSGLAVRGVTGSVLEDGSVLRRSADGCRLHDSSHVRGVRGRDRCADPQRSAHLEHDVHGVRGGTRAAHDRGDVDGGH
jgi:hypothetical protein